MALQQQALDQTAQSQHAGGGASPAPLAPVPAFGRHMPGPPAAALTNTKNRELYRARPADELEEVTWYVNAQARLLAQPRKERLVSQISRAPCVIIFVNSTPFRVRPLWMDFNGAEVAYTPIAPRETKRFRTYVSHPWIVREESTGARMMLSGRMAVVGLQEEQQVVINAPCALPWTWERHSCFPQEFKSTVKAFLLAHKKAEALAAASRACQAAGGAASEPGAPDCCRGSPPPQPQGAQGCQAGVRSLRQQLPAVMSISACVGGAVTATVTVSPRVGGAAGPAKLTPDQARDQSLPVAPGGHASTTSQQLPAGSGVLAPAPTPSVGLTRSAGSGAHHAAAAAAPAGPLDAVPKRARFDGGRSVLGSLLCSFKSLLGPAAPGHAGSHNRDCDAHTPRDARQRAMRRTGSHDSLGSPKHRRTRAAAAPSGSSSSSSSSSSDSSSSPGPCSSFGALPTHLVVRIVELAAPEMYQHINRPLLGRPDILPALLACAPEEAAHQAQPGAAAHQPAQAAAPAAGNAAGAAADLAAA